MEIGENEESFFMLSQMVMLKSCKSLWFKASSQLQAELYILLRQEIALYNNRHCYVWPLHTKPLEDFACQMPNNGKNKHFILKFKGVDKWTKDKLLKSIVHYSSGFISSNLYVGFSTFLQWGQISPVWSSSSLEICLNAPEQEMIWDDWVKQINCAGLLQDVLSPYDINYVHKMNTWTGR